ncbi:MAG: phenylacetic acid degradation protein [Chloroflexota bacterium]
MADTQWPRYEVFKQDKQGRTHEAIGTVHASDGEIAIQNARDVHVRRPGCVSLWVAPESAILKVTTQEVTARASNFEEAGITGGTAYTNGLDSPDAVQDSYQVFVKNTLRRSMSAATHLGQVEAHSAESALRLAMAHPEWSRNTVYVWWIVPEHSIIRSQEDDILSMFEPASRKTYKQQSRYGLIERGSHSIAQSIPSSVIDEQASID